MDDDGIADITADLRFDRAILLFWYIDNQVLMYFFKINRKNLSKRIKMINENQKIIKQLKENL
jgi:hypothetical protein